MTPGRRRTARALLPLLLLLGSTLLNACRTLTPGAPTPSGLGATLPAGDPRPERFLDALVREGEKRRALRGVASLALDGPSGSARAKQIVLLERPARLRVEVLGFLNQSVAVLTTDGERFRLFRAEDRSLQEGAIRASLLWEVAGIALSPDAAVGVLLGAPAIPDGARPLPARVTANGGVRVSFDHDGLVLALEFDGEGALRRWRIEEAGQGRALLEATFSEYAALAGTAFAHQIELLDHRHGTRARVQFSDVELNPDLPPEVFVLERGARR